MVNGEKHTPPEAVMRNPPPYSNGSELRCVKEYQCERQQSSTVLEGLESTTPLKAEGRQIEIHPAYTRIAHINPWKDQFLSSDYRDLQHLH